MIHDDIGSIVIDIAAAHSRAIRLANHMMRYSRATNRAPDFERWVVKVTDENQQPVLIYPIRFAHGSVDLFPSNDARALFLVLEAMMGPGRHCSHTLPQTY